MRSLRSDVNRLASVRCACVAENKRGAVEFVPPPFFAHLSLSVYLRLSIIASSIIHIIQSRFIAQKPKILFV